MTETVDRVVDRAIAQVLKDAKDSPVIKAHVAGKSWKYGCRKCVVAVVWSNRSEEGLLRPVIEELKRHEEFEVEEWKIPDNIYEVAEYVCQLEKAGRELPDLAITPYDRPPVTLMAYFLYHVHVPLVQLHAGDISSGTFDDMNRWCISLWATYHFCAGTIQANRLKRFLKAMGREPKYINVSGVTNLDDIGKMSEPPDGDYDVVIYNSPTRNPETVGNDLEHIVNLLDKETYWIEPQGSAEDKYIIARAKDFAQTTGKTIAVIPTMPHESLLGLFSRAKRVIGNSSALFFEAPYFGCEVVQIGERNKTRENVLLKPGGSKRIVKRLREWLAL